MAHLKTRATRHDAEERFRWKTHLVRRLYKKSYERKEVLDLFRFIDWLLALPAELEEKFSDDLRRYEAEVKMRYVTHIERQGIRKGLRQGETSVLKRQLVRRFDRLPVWAERRLDEASQAEIECWADRVIDAKVLDEVFAPIEPADTDA